jgi:uncharacterized membrane protein YdjX (TVP38/TMEM64 family)
MSRSRNASVIWWASAAVLVGSLLVLARALPLEVAASVLRSWIEAQGVQAPLIFGVIYVFAVVAMLPASLLTLLAGASFGPVVGTVTVVLSANIGAAIALLIARYLARERIESLARRRPKFAAIDRAIDEGGWKIVALLRLSPVVPFNVQNYLYGLTSIGFWTCVVTSLFAMLPGTFLYIYLGHVAGTVSAAGNERSGWEWLLMVVGLLATATVTVYVTVLARRNLGPQIAQPEESSARDEGADDDEFLSNGSTFLLGGCAAVAAVLAIASVVDPGTLRDPLLRLFEYSEGE